jgi:hypothetical protein
MAPPLEVHVFCPNVEPTIETTDPGMYTAPPGPCAVFPVVVQFVKFALPLFGAHTTPPELCAIFPVDVQFVKFTPLLLDAYTTPPDELMFPVAVQFVKTTVLPPGTSTTPPRSIERLVANTQSVAVKFDSVRHTPP